MVFHLFTRIHLYLYNKFICITKGTVKSKINQNKILYQINKKTDYMRDSNDYKKALIIMRSIYYKYTACLLNNVSDYLGVHILNINVLQSF